jgi:MEDS: MEthanogen/methylotroph, DcmR Sensory domain
MASWAELLTRAAPGEHVVQLYGEDDPLLARNASRYLAEGLRRGDGLVVIATPEHTSAIARHLVEEEPGTEEAVRSGRLVYRDAGETLAALLGDDGPDPAKFRAVVGRALGDVRARSTTGQVRAFGEMVSLLWGQGRRADAERLEDLWNGLLAEAACSLYCAYGIDLFHRRDEPAGLHPIVRTHDHVLAGSGTLLSSGRARG